MAALTGSIQVYAKAAADMITDAKTLLVGQLGFETDTGKFKIGDGVTEWSDLEYGKSPFVKYTDAQAVPAGSPPGATDDINAGFTKGCLWLHKDTPFIIMHFCFDNTAGAAQWGSLGGISTAESPSGAADVIAKFADDDGVVMVESWLSESGTTLSLHADATIVQLNTALVKGVTDPVDAQDAATKAYVDASSGATNLSIGVQDGVQVRVDSSTGTNATITAATGAVAGVMVAADKTKLDGVETAATADQTGAEIKAAYEGEANTNAFTDAAVTKLAGIETAADVTDATNVTAAGAHMSGGTDVPITDGGTGQSTAQAAIDGLTNVSAATNEHVLTKDTGTGNAIFKAVPGGGGGEANTASNVGTAGVGVFKTKTGVDLEFKKINAGSTKITITDDTGNDELDIDVAPGNIATSTLNNDAAWTNDQTGAEIKTAYELEADTNAFTDADHSKLDGIEASADVTDATNVTAAGAHMSGGTDVPITDGGTGQSTAQAAIDALTNVSAATNEHVLTKDTGTGNAIFKAVAGGGGLGSVVEDTTPQLGGMLDVNGFAIGDGTLKLLDFVEDASAVNYIEIENEATLSGPIIRSTGTDANVDLNLAAKGTGVVRTDSDINITGSIILSGEVDGRDVAADGSKLDGIETAATADQTGAQIKTAYEAEADTNAYTDAAVTKLAGIETAADVTDAANVNAAGAVMESDFTGADKYLYATGASTVVEGTITTAGRALIDDANAAAQRTTLGLAALATLATVDTAQIDDEAVTLAKLAHMATASFMGRLTAATGDPEILTAAQARQILEGGTMGWALSDESTALTASTSVPVVTDYLPYDFEMTGIEICCTTAPTGTGGITVDVHKSGTTIFTVKPVITVTNNVTITDGTESGSTWTMSKDDKLEFFIDGVGSTIAGAGLKCRLIGYRR